MKNILLFILIMCLIMTSCYISPITEYELVIIDNGQYSEDKTYHIVTISGPDGFEDFCFNSGSSPVADPSSHSKKYSPGEYQGIDSCTYNGILIKEGDTVKAVGYRKEKGSSYATFVAAKTIPVSKWDISIVDNGPYSEDTAQHIVTITDSSWNGSIYYNFGKYDTPTSDSIWYRAEKYTGSDGKQYSGILVPEGSIIKAVSYKNINYITYSSNIVEKDLDQWAISIVDNGPSLDDNNKRIVSIVDSVYSSSDIYYTLDGSIPTSSSTKYVPAEYTGTDSKTYFGILLPEATIVKTIAERTENGKEISSFVSEKETEITPWEISIIDCGQAFDDRTKHVVVIEDSKWNGTIKFTLNNTTPTLFDYNYSWQKVHRTVAGLEVKGVLVSEEETIKAVSFKEKNTGLVQSIVAEKTIDKCNWEIVVTDCGQFIGDESKRIISIIDSEKSGDIFYTLDGNVPTRESTAYTPEEYQSIDSIIYKGILVDAGATISAVSYRGAGNRTEASSIADLKSGENKWTISIVDNGPSYYDKNSRIVTIVDDKVGTVYYTINGYDPDQFSSDSYRYTPKECKGVDGKTYYGVVISEGVIVKAVSYSDQITSFIAETSVGIRSWEIKINDMGQSIDDGAKHIICIEDRDRFGDIYYTTDGSEPDMNSLKYEPQSSKNNNQENCVGVLIEEGTLLKAVSFKNIFSNLVSSDKAEIQISTYRWEITIVDHGQYFADGAKHIISIEDSERDGDIYYSIGNLGTTLESSPYSSSFYLANDSIEYEGFLVKEGEIVNAISAYSDGGIIKTSYVSNKTVDVLQWPIEIIQCAVSKEDETKRIVLIKDALKNGALFYTLDETIPTGKSLEYSPKEYVGVDSEKYYGMLVDGEAVLKAVSYDTDENGIVVSSNVAEVAVEKVLYKIGEKGPSGGYIFDDKGGYSNGYRYFEAASQDLKGAYEFGYNMDYFGVTGKTGIENTDALIEILGDGDYAAKACADFDYKGFNDWFLPNVSEMTLMYRNLYLRGIGGFVSNGHYWTSQEDGKYNAYYVGFKYGSYDIEDRRNTCFVRPARVF